MTRRLFAMGSLLVNGWLSMRPLSACGDKSSSSARGMWRGQGPSGKREDILIVLDDDVRKALPHPDYVEADLVNEGFFPTPAYRPEDITEKLKERKWSLIVAGLAHVDEVAAIHGTNRILLVALDASDKEKTAAKKKYSGVITKVAKDFVVDVADALESARLKKNA